MAKRAAKKSGRKPAKRQAKTETVLAPLSDLSLSELQRELGRRQGEAAKLQRRRERLAAQLQEIDEQLSALGANGMLGVTGVRTRPRNEKTLTEALHEVLTGQEMGVTEVAEAVQAAGYKTHSPNFRTIVNQTLIREDCFKKVSRGIYTAK